MSLLEKLAAKGVSLLDDGIVLGIETALEVVRASETIEEARSNVESLLLRSRKVCDGKIPPEARKHA